jgi:5-hydroxyisourate hydrolase
VTELTTHVLDTAGGRPASGIPVSLQTQTQARPSGDWSEIAAATTDADGRTGPLSAAGAQPHRLVFDLRGRGGFYPEVAITFEVGADDDHLHVPLLLSPFGYTTYRGS